MIFTARQFEFRFPRPALLMGIVNVTPDSFSDGGKFLDPEAAVAHALKLVAEGADILDIGGESTRPGATPVGAEEELRRVIPVITQLAPQVNVPLSIDTSKPAVARAALAAGASIVNDVAAARSNAAMWQVVAEYHAGYIVMHAQGTPTSMQQQPAYAEVIGEVGDFFSERLNTLLNEAGIPAAQVALDPGIGFGKTLEHNLSLLANLHRFTKRRRPLLVGVSRKSLLGAVTGAKVNERLPAALACTILAVAAGANIIRTHDVPETRLAIRMAEAILAQKKHVA